MTKRERENLVNFIKEHPYLDYNFGSNDLTLKRHQSLEQYAEYGDINHFMNTSPIKIYSNRETR